MPQHRHIWMPTLVALLLVVATAAANVPRAFNFQARITDGGEGPVNLEVKFWDAATEGQELFSELHESVPLHDGVFSIRIGSVVGGIPDLALSAPQVWLGVSVDGGEELPRARLLSVPFSERARSAARLVRLEPFDPVMQVLPNGAVAVGSANPGVVLLRDGGPENPVTMELVANDGDGGASIRMGSGPVPGIMIGNEETGLMGGSIEVGNGTATTIKLAGGGTRGGGGMIELGDATAPTVTLDGGAGAVTVVASGLEPEGSIRVLDSEGNVGVEAGLDLDPYDICYGGGYEEYYAIKDTLLGSVLTLRLKASDIEHGFPCDWRIDLWDDEGRQAIRLHSDRVDDAPELAMFMGPETGQLRETIELTANSEGGDSYTGGQIKLRRVEDPSQAAKLAVELKARGHDAVSGGLIGVCDFEGSRTVYLQGGESGQCLGYEPLIKVSNEEASCTIGAALWGPGGEGGSYVSLRDNQDRLLAWMAGDSFHGGIIVLRDLDNTDTISLDGDEGRVTAKVVEITGADLAEKFPTSEEVKSGMVVAIDPENAGQLCLARGAYNRCVAGIVSGANDFSAGAILGCQPGHENAPPVALSGRVWCWCDASSGAIQPGDLLTSSDTPGHAMKLTDYPKAQGAIIGKAMTSLESGRGMVLVLVSLQ